jgi:MtN3 and saliva related transmembrane protein
MDFQILDSNVSVTMNVFLVFGNIINLIYNIPQMVKTYKTKSTGDFSPTFLFLRVIGNSIWLAYSIELKTFLFLLSNIVSVFASLFICYYKVRELYIIPRNRNHESLLDDHRASYEQFDDTIVEV